MLVQVRFFASLREKLGLNDCALELPSPAVAMDVWSLATQQTLPANTLIAINQEFAKPDSAVHANDEVAFFPPVTGG